MNLLCFNGQLFPAETPLFPAGNRGYRYGDGLFETMKLIRGRIILENYHTDRLFKGLELLKFRVPGHFTPSLVREQVQRLAAENNLAEQARIRLSISRGNGSLQDAGEDMQYLIECMPLASAANDWNTDGYIIDIYPNARKSADHFSGLKTASHLPYAMAARYALDQELQDCLILNHQHRVADSSIANLFIVAGGTISTPPLSEGPVNGVMRRYLIENLRKSGYKVSEKEIDEAALHAADEVFLTNAITGIRWVKQFRDKTYSNHFTEKIYRELVQTIFR